MDKDTLKAREEKFAKLDEDGKGHYDDDASSYKSGYSEDRSRAGPKMNRSIRDDDHRINRA